MSEVSGNIKWILQTEGLVILIVSCFLYHYQGYSWGTFALFFLAPDLSFFGYLANSKVGAVCYNTAHSAIGPLLCLLLGLAYDHNTMLMAGVIWYAHIGFDRALGYGLKYSQGFGYTHLGQIGKDKQVNR